jgi:hypothetical protein
VHVVQGLLAAVVACVVAGLLWTSLDSGIAGQRADRLVSLPLLGLAAIFGASAWASAYAGMQRRTPVMVGLALGVGGYALVRLVAL